MLSRIDLIILRIQKFQARLVLRRAPSEQAHQRLRTVEALIQAFR